MLHQYQCWLLRLVSLLAVIYVQASGGPSSEKNGMKSGVFLSPKFELEPGFVEKKYYYNMDFPRGYIAVKELNAEIVDEEGKSIPLYETYLHHFIVARYYKLKDNETSSESRPRIILLRTNGVCQELIQYFGVGSETRRMDNHLPDPYGMIVGNPTEIPDGYEEQLLLGIHAIDTRDVEDVLGCIECRCDLYNVTVGEEGNPLRPGYVGGEDCCYDQTRCRVKKGYTSARRGLHLRYKVKWVDWDETIVPIKTYVFDITYTDKKVEGTLSSVAKHCKLEYDIEPCSASGMSNNGCLDNKRTMIVMPKDGYVIYGGAHQHFGAINATVYGEDGRTICSSIPIYGDGKGVGNEAGYIVEMSTCYPEPGSMKISAGEKLVLESNYNSSQRHSGVMALFYILVADHIPKEAPNSHTPIHEIMKLSKYLLAVVFAGVAMLVVAMLGNRRRKQQGYGLIFSIL